MEGFAVWSSPRQQLSWRRFDRVLLRLVGAIRVDPVFGFHSHSNHGKGGCFQKRVEANRVVRFCGAYGGSGGSNLGREVLLKAALVCHPGTADGDIVCPCFSERQAVRRNRGCLPLASRRTVGKRVTTAWSRCLFGNRLVRLGCRMGIHANFAARIYSDREPGSIFL